MGAGEEVEMGVGAEVEVGAGAEGEAGVAPYYSTKKQSAVNDPEKSQEYVFVPRAPRLSRTSMCTNPDTIPSSNIPLSVYCTEPLRCNTEMVPDVTSPLAH